MRAVKYTYLLFLAVLFLPLAQQWFSFAGEKKLKGYFQEEPMPEFSIGKFDSLLYQEQAERYLCQHFGFRNTCYRLRNQFYFSIFDQSPNANFCKGANDNYFENVYIDAYFGNDFAGERQLRELTGCIKRLQDSLGKYHKLLLTVVAPSKADYAAEFIPSYFDRTPGNPMRNYELFCRLASERGMNFIDFNSWFLALKGKTQYPLYYPDGTHWSVYGASLAFDSMYKVIRKLYPRDLPSLEIDGTFEEMDRGYDDHDVFYSFNLLFDRRRAPSYFPDFTVHREGKFIPSVLAVTDSYYGVMVQTGLPAACFKSPDYWFSNRELMPHEKYDTITHREHFLEQEIRDHQVFILMVTPHNIPWTGWEFPENALRLFDRGEENTVGYSCDYYRKLWSTRQFMLSDKNWLGSILRQAKSEKADPDSMLYFSLRYAVDGPDWRNK